MYRNQTNDSYLKTILENNRKIYFNFNKLKTFSLNEQLIKYREIRWSHVDLTSKNFQV